MPDKLGFEQLRARARRLTTRAIEDKASYASVEKAVAAAEEDKRHRDKALAKADEALEAWKTSWSKAFSDLWLEQRDSAQMRALLDPLRRLATAGKPAHGNCSAESARWRRTVGSSVMQSISWLPDLMQTNMNIRQQLLST